MEGILVRGISLEVVCTQQTHRRHLGTFLRRNRTEGNHGGKERCPMAPPALTVVSFSQLFWSSPI